MKRISRINDIGSRTSARRKAKAGEGRGNYFRIRDFEYVQPLYDLAFLLEIDALAKGREVPKYRTFSLWRAAYSLDGYGTTIDRWLDGAYGDDDLDYVPSNRIRQYLAAVRLKGTIPELKPFRSERFERCLRLRAIRGLGPHKIALTISSASLEEDWFTQAAIGLALDRDKLADRYRKSSNGPWQAAHVVPPLLRFLKSLEAIAGNTTDWVITGIQSPFDAITTPISVAPGPLSTPIETALRSTLRKERLFRMVGDDSAGSFDIRHQMGWGASIVSLGQSTNGKSISAWAQLLDPFVSLDPATVLSDLHLHTAWSDGSASVDTMARALSDRGQTHFAVTDHSRSSKLQGGLTPPLWLRQANALALAAPVCPILHGIEVDILRDGQLDLPHSLLSAADIVVASVHSNWTENTQTNTSRLIKAIHSGCIDILAHPTSGLTGKPGVPDYLRTAADVDWDVVFLECALWRVAIEFNCFPSRLDMPIPMLRRAIELGCVVSLGSDAHARSHLQNIRFGEAALNHLGTCVVLNRMPLDQLKQWIYESRAIRRGLPETAQALRQGQLFPEEASLASRRLSATIQPPHQIPEGATVVGIDLTAGQKATGVALLKEMTITTCSLFSDEDIIDYIAVHRPEIVSIDSPLGLPGGGESIDPTAGIVRVAEHELASIGIPAYPALIDSMRELTLRGIRLRRAIESFDPAPRVIESYPGAAQDILCIPRKQKSLGLLREGLRRLGIRGSGLETKSHDEMDAATSAIVGRYFESGLYEPMGVASEAQLIVPKIGSLRFDRPPVICLSGKTGAGKSVVARYLSVFYGFQWIPTRQIIARLLERDLSRPKSERLYKGDSDLTMMTEQDLRDFGACLLNEHKQLPVQLELSRTIGASAMPVVVDSVRDLDDVSVTSLLNRPMLIWFVDCSDSIIRHRLTAKSKQGIRRLKTPSPVDYTAPNLRRAADRLINNSGTLEELRWRVDDVLFADLTLRAR